MTVVEVDVNAELRNLLPGADFADAYSRTVEDPTLDAISAARRAIEQQPGWVRALMRLRDAIVRPLGLRTADDPSLARLERIGLFPVIGSTPKRVVLGFNDSHLDFRLVIDVATLGELRRQVIVTTLVQTHNWLGRIYLAMVMPFHRRIVPAMLARDRAGAVT
jgi:hypothetical protein